MNRGVRPFGEDVHYFGTGDLGPGHIEVLLWTIFKVAHPQMSRMGSAPDFDSLKRAVLVLTCEPLVNH